MRSILLTISYDGTDFHGWQRQPGVRTVQGVIEEALWRLTSEHQDVTASGRTDAGVHALGQAVQFHTASSHSPATFVKALNAMLPPDVRVREACEVPLDFHATLSAVSKRYRYVIDNGRVCHDPMGLRYAWHLYYPLHAPLMHAAGQALCGTHDFRSFETHWPNRLTSVRTIFEVSVERAGDRVLVEVEANGFLYNMVRAITGTLVLVGSGKRPAGWVAQVVAAQARVEAGPTAPPQGLFLLRVRYEHSHRADASPGAAPSD